MTDDLAHITLQQKSGFFEKPDFLV